MMKPDGTWVCPICGAGVHLCPPVHGATCWHWQEDHSDGCSTWYGGRLLHFTVAEVDALKLLRASPQEYKGHFSQLRALGFSDVPSRMETLTAEGENLCRHLWGIKEVVAKDRDPETGVFDPMAYLAALVAGREAWKQQQPSTANPFRGLSDFEFAGWLSGWIRAGFAEHLETTS